MDREKFDKIITEREFWAQFQEADPVSLDKVWKNLTDILSENIEDTINFMKNEINCSEFMWISEVFDDIVDKTQSKEFIKCLYELEEKFRGEYDCNILGSIEFAEEFIE